MTTDPWARYRSHLQKAVEDAAADVDLSHGELVREQLAATQGGEGLRVGIVCLRAAEALGSDAAAALPGATALALLAQMADVFLSLESQDGGASLSTAWGMPRALNAGDAFYAAAQNALITDDGEISVQRRLLALSILDDATRELTEALYSAGDGARVKDGERSLLKAALLLAGVYAGSDDDAMSRLKGLGMSWSNLTDSDIESAVASDIKAALAAVK